MALVFFGARTISHEALKKDLDAADLGKVRAQQIEQLILAPLDQKAARLSAIVEFLPNLPSTTKDIENLLAKEPEIDNLFILEGTRLIYPMPNKNASQQEMDWQNALLPIQNDPSLLWNYNRQSELENPTSGWFILNDKQLPSLIYWQQKEAQKDGKVLKNTLGFRLSYTQFLSEVINAIDVDFSPMRVRVKENARILYQSPLQQNSASKNDNEEEVLPLVYLRLLPYPLFNWQIEYEGLVDKNALYFWGYLLLLVLFSLLTLFFWQVARSYRQNLKNAQLQVNFVGQVSHELKTPLTNILLYAELLKEGFLEEEEDKTSHQKLRKINIISEESARLTRLIQNVLSLNNAPKVNLQKVDLGAQLVNIGAQFAPCFRQKNIALMLQESASLTLKTDIDKLTQIISNFLSNAEKYAANGKKVELGFQKNGAFVDIYVRDFGEGIAPKELAKIFTPFYRSSSKITEGVAGTGIGLTIAKQLAMSLGGKISATNENSGMRFVLSLPLIEA